MKPEHCSSLILYLLSHFIFFNLGVLNITRVFKLCATEPLCLYLYIPMALRNFSFVYVVDRYRSFIILKTWMKSSGHVMMSIEHLNAFLRLISAFHHGLVDSNRDR